MGIDVRNIVSRTTYGDTARTGADMFDLGSLLSCRPFDAPKSDMTCLRLQTDTGVLFLLVDQVVKEIEITEPPVPLPSSSPPLAGQLCPKAVIHENSVVLLLEPTQVVPVCKRLGNDIGRIRLPLSSEGIDSVPPEKKKVTCGYFSVSAIRICFNPAFSTTSPIVLITFSFSKITLTSLKSAL